MWHKHHEKPSEIVPDPEDQKSILEKVGEAGYKAGLEKGQDAAREVQALLDEEERKLGRRLEGEERENFINEHKAKIFKKFLTDNIQNIFGGEENK